MSNYKNFNPLDPSTWNGLDEDDYRSMATGNEQTDAAIRNAFQVADDVYEQHLKDFNAEISKDSCPECGLTKTKGHQCMGKCDPNSDEYMNIVTLGALAGGIAQSVTQSGAPPWEIQKKSVETWVLQETHIPRKSKGLSCGELALIAAVGAGLLLFMMTFL